MLELIPTQTESRESASPNISASLISIPFEPSKSKGIGSIIIIIPSNISIPELTIFVKNSERIPLIKSPIKNEIEVNKIDIAMSINIDTLRILAFFIPYVTPIPNESILTESASKHELIIVALKTSYIYII